MWRNSNGGRQAKSVSTEIVKRESIHISISAAGRWLPYNNSTKEKRLENEIR
jgi:hypothetical protein